MQLNYQVFRDSKLLAEGVITAPFQIGRQDSSEGDPPPVCVNERHGRRKLVFADMSSDLQIPRQAALVSIEGSEIVVENIRKIRPGNDGRIQLAQGIKLRSGEKLKLREEAVFQFSGGLSIRINPLPEPKKAAPSLRASAIEETLSFRVLSGDLLKPPEQGSGLSQTALANYTKPVTLVKTALRPFDEVPGSPKFYATVVQSVREMLSVDRALILVSDPNGWSILVNSNSANSQGNEPNPTQPAQLPFDGSYSRSLIQRVLECKQTVIVEPIARSNDIAASLQEIHRAIASPIFDENRKIIAILYADRLFSGPEDQPIGELEASLLEVVASAVSTGLMRQRDEEFRVAAGQFFSRKVLDRLSTQKDLLEGRDAEVSVLFCDIRGFSKIAERVSPADMLKWLNDVLTNLSECVLRYDGVVVDYIGDALMAMFGAPEPQSDHADRACRAACDMLRLVPFFQERIRHLVPDPFGIGIGVNTGNARVGNTGSKLKYKYGPLGNTVNVASRVEGITKQIGAPGLITGSTKKSLSSNFLTRRLTEVRVVGISEPVQLYEIQNDDSPSRRELIENYEWALDNFERQQFSEATVLLASLVKEWPKDLPSQLLLRRAVAAISQTEPFDPVWILNQK